LTRNSASQQTIQRASGNTEISVNYTQQGVYGSTTISVLSGSIEILDEHGNWVTLTAGQELIINDQVPKTRWVMPTDGGSLYGGELNNLMWMTYPDAPGYTLEYNVPQPVFSENNTDTLEYSEQTFDFFSDTLSHYEDISFVEMMMPDAPGLVVELRLFAIDEALNVLADSVSSDKIRLTFE
jgi:hypothetical protein